MNEELEPLSYKVPPPTPRPSFARNLQLSSYLFPSNLRLSVSSSSTRGGEDKQAIEREYKSKIASNHSLSDTSDYQMATIANKQTSTKKKVSFQCKVVLIPPEHSPTEEEKSCIFYNKEDYDRFKFDAAQNAEVRLFDYFPPEPGEGPNAPSTCHKFVMIGNFDKDHKKSSLPTDATVDGRSMHAAKPISHHVPIKCHNEYTDVNTKEGEVCKRGLGYHFSRHRKRNRVWTRAMILTWQKTMREMKVEDGRIQEQARHFQQQPLKLSQKCEVKLNEKSQRLLAVVSSKCSRTSRQAALWRGTMDYEMAYPEENHKVSFDLARGVDQMQPSVSVMKRAHDHWEEQPRRKRHRNDTSNDSSNAYTYLTGVLAVPI